MKFGEILPGGLGGILLTDEGADDLHPMTTI